MWLLCPRDCDLTSTDARVGVVCAAYRLVFVDFGTIKDKKKVTKMSLGQKCHLDKNVTWTILTLGQK